jgi:phospholipase C
MIVASPWSRGGRVCSQVFDHTSVFRFVQTWLNKKSNAGIDETNISSWRKTITGDLTSAFQRYDGASPEQLPWLKKQPFIEKIFNARFRPEPTGYTALSAPEITQINDAPASSPSMARQEPGVKTSCALPYQLYADGHLGEDGKVFVIRLEARKELFGDRSAGSPFNLFETGKDMRSYAVIAGDSLTDRFPLHGDYYFEVHGPNGFCRQYKGNRKNPRLHIDCEYERQPNDSKQLTGRIQLRVRNHDAHRPYTLTLIDRSYKKEPITRNIAAGAKADVLIETASSHGWYDFSVTVKGFDTFEQTYSGRVETGKDGFSDPFMGAPV